MFEVALEMPREQRSAWLATECGGDLELLSEVIALLQAHAREHGILERSPARLAQELEPEPDREEGRRIGAYRIVRELGRGGMGVVYLAVRDDGQFQHRVALKLLRGSPDAEELHRRFLAERQILASLQHPNISQLLDGGIADGRLPYLVMEYVEGVPITEYCDRQRLGLTARLRLFLEVCDAVHHAHKNLVLHRDLKPGNILVTASGQVKLLDFGIA
jgi:serine/threonine-protein kinase